VINSDSSKGAYVPTISTLGLDQPTQTADVSPGSLGTVEFSGTVSCELNSATTAIVTLTAEDTWGTAVVTPEAIQFSSSDRSDKVFRVSVQAPLGISSSIVGQVIVKGSIVYYPSNLKGTVQPRDGIVGRIDIEPYYDFKLKCFDKYIESIPNYNEVFNIHLLNLGNHIDTFHINIENDDELKKKGLDVHSIFKVLNIREKEERVVMVKIKTPNGFNVYGLHEINISAYSQLYLEESGEYLIDSTILRIRIPEHTFFQSYEFCVSSFIIYLVIGIVPIIWKIKRKKRIINRK
jgi:hypothetical protein